MNDLTLRHITVGDWILIEGEPDRQMWRQVKMINKLVCRLYTSDGLQFHTITGIECGGRKFEKWRLRIVEVRKHEI